MTEANALNVDDSDFVYRYQTRDSLLHMYNHVGKNLAASIWLPKRSYPHEVFLEKQENLPGSYAIYNLSVWRNEYFARCEIRNYARENEIVLLRIPRSALNESGLVVIDDDGLPGQALLCYEISPYDGNQIYGLKHISWSDVRQNDPVWGNVQIEAENFFAVPYPLSPEYIVKDFDNDDGLPFEERMLRAYLRNLVNLEEGISKTPFWNLLQHQQLRGARYAVLNVGLGFDCFEPRMSAAINRLQLNLPSNHAWCPLLVDLLHRHRG